MPGTINTYILLNLCLLFRGKLKIVSALSAYKI